MFDLVSQTNLVFQCPSESVQLTTHRLDWDTSLDLRELMPRRLTPLGQRLKHGAWFFCPKFTVYAETPSYRFFEAARLAVSHWLMQARQAMEEVDPRRVNPKEKWQDRLAAYLVHPIVEGGPPERSPEVINPSDLTEDQRLVVLAGGMLTKEFPFIGRVMFDGAPVSPITWVEMVGDLVRSKPAANVTTTRRRIHWEAVKAAGDPSGPLKSMSEDELRAHLAANPDAALYVAPGVTVVAPTPSRAFLNAVRKRSDEWHAKLDLALGKHKKPLARSADISTQMLAYTGTLVIGGQCHLPGCWPDDHPTEARLRQTPFRSPIVPLEFLGLTPFPALKEK